MTDSVYASTVGPEIARPVPHTGNAVRSFKLGLSGCGGGLESISTSQILDLAEKVEALGFTGVWLNEEHFQGSIVEVEGRRCHSPLILASAILARTRRLRVGFSVLLAALHNPVRLAEEIATLDVISAFPAATSPVTSTPTALSRKAPPTISRIC
jgi:hypothetical protein